MMVVWPLVMAAALVVAACGTDETDEPVGASGEPAGAEGDGLGGDERDAASTEAGSGDGDTAGRDTDGGADGESSDGAGTDEPGAPAAAATDDGTAGDDAASEAGGDDPAEAGPSADEVPDELVDRLAVGFVATSNEEVTVTEAGGRCIAEDLRPLIDVEAYEALALLIEDDRSPGPDVDGAIDAEEAWIISDVLAGCLDLAAFVDAVVDPGRGTDRDVCGRGGGPGRHRGDRDLRWVGLRDAAR